MRRNRIATVVVASTLAVAMLASAASASAKLPPPGTATQVAKLVAASHLITVLPKSLLSKVATASNDNPGTIYPLTKGECTTLTQCIFGDTKAAKTIVLMGDSHAQMWIPAINRIGMAKKLKVILLFLPVCPAASLNVWITVFNAAYTQCSTDRSAWISALNKAHPMAILLTERTYGIYSAASGGHTLFTDAQWQAGLETTITDLAPSKAKIVVLGDIVTFDSPVPSCLAANVTSVQKCSVPNPNPARPNHASAEKAAAKAEKVLFVDPTKWACTTICSPVIGTYIAYYDQYHFSVTYDGYLSGVLTTALKSVL